MTEIRHFQEKQEHRKKLKNDITKEKQNRKALIIKSLKRNKFILELRKNNRLKKLLLKTSLI